MFAAAIWLSAAKLRSSFSHRTSSLRKRLNQLWRTSTAQRRTFLTGSRRSAPAAMSSVGAKGPAATHAWVLRLTVMACSTESSCVTSCSSAPVTTSDNGTPRSPTSRRRLPRFFPDRSGCARPPLAPGAPRAWPRRCFAIATRCPPSGRTRQARLARSPRMDDFSEGLPFFGRVAPASIADFRHGRAAPRRSETDAVCPGDRQATARDREAPLR